MDCSTALERRERMALAGSALESYQLERLNCLLDQILPANRFYAQRLAQVRRPIRALDELAALPYTFKESLLTTPVSQGPAHLSDLHTFARAKYVRYHQTSGTRGRPLPVLDTADDWRWWIECWQYVYDAAEVQARDCVFLAFSFGPFIGFWSAHDAAIARGCMVVPGGGLNTLGRLELIRSSGATVVCCTPSYALRLAEVAQQHHVDCAELGVRVLILAGEPGGSMPAVRQRIESAWGARVLDHAGATEVGPWGVGDAAGTGLHIIESEFIAEFISLEHGGPAAEGELSELVLTNLGRVGAPVLRYRTGDLVCPSWTRPGPIRFVHLPGGIHGRVDDMLVIRGVNIFPTAIEQIVRSFPEVVEYRATAHKVHELDQISIEIEDRLQQPKRVAEELRLRLGLKIDVRCVPLGSLPRFEGKGQRLIDQR
ncbi:MAG: phenylacetate--CoA ligase family protein [Planctomycetaceae bacterium]|nr:phenylacetate--CoA ligase family protein [Planctomycetaceae bacterium]